MRMDSPTPTQLLEPFHLFCVEGRNVKTLLNPSGPAAAQHRAKQRACKEIYRALLPILTKLNTSDQANETLPPRLLELFQSLVDDNVRQCSIRLDDVAFACAKVPKTRENCIDWRADSDEVGLLEKSSTAFFRNVTLRHGLWKKLVEELEAYGEQLKGYGVQIESATDSPTEIPPMLVQSFVGAQRLAESMFNALEEVATAACRCSGSPKPHGYEMRLPILPRRLQNAVLKLQLRKWQDKWQHAWVGMSPESDFAEVRHDTGLCAQLTIASVHSHYLNFVFSDGTLQVCPLLPRPISSPEFATDAQSLETLISSFPQLGKKMIRTVALKLAWSAVYLHGGGWLKQIWDDASIFFIERDKDWIPPHPHLCTRLPSQTDEHDCTALCFGCVKQQRSPHLLQLASLGLMLMELHSGVTARKFATDCNLSKDNVMVMADHFFNVYWREMAEEDHDYLDSVKACLDRSFGIENGKSVLAKDLRSQMLRRIVAPLYKSLRHYCHSHEDLERTLDDESATLTELGKHVQQEPSSPLREVNPEPLSPVTESSGGAYIKSSTSESTGWFSRFDQVLNIMELPCAEQKTHTRVKIAVLDTGFRPDHAHEAKFQYVDYVEPEKRCKTDVTGHGTKSVELILRVYPDAEVFIARVFKTNTVDGVKEPKWMAEAIKWAADKGVDIISISAGFVNESHEVLEAIKEARKSNPDLLIFAAASNYGNLHNGVAYPAKHHDYVFCIFSCSGNLKQTDKTNPNPSNTDNFAMLGEDVRVFPGHVLDGSSIATALAAGFAARIMDFSRHEETIDFLKCRGLTPDRLSTREGIRAIFRRVSVPAGKFQCIAPWMLWKLGTKGQPRQEPQRSHVYNVLEDILQNPLD